MLGADKVSFFMPDEIDPHADVVCLLGGSEESKLVDVDVGEKGYGKAVVSFSDRFVACTFEAYLWRRLGLVHVYQRISHGRRVA